LSLSVARNIEETIKQFLLLLQLTLKDNSFN
jgi:hypothetical protein